MTRRISFSWTKQTWPNYDYYRNERQILCGSTACLLRGVITWMRISLWPTISYHGQPGSTILDWLITTSGTTFLSHCPAGYPSLITADQIAAVESFLVEHTAVLTELDALGVRMRIAIKTKMLIDIGNPQSAYRNVLFGKTFLRALSPFFPEICFDTYVDAVNFNAWPEDVQRQNPIG